MNKKIPLSSGTLPAQGILFVIVIASHCLRLKERIGMRVQNAIVLFSQNHHDSIRTPDFIAVFVEIFVGSVASVVVDRDAEFLIVHYTSSVEFCYWL